MLAFLSGYQTQLWSAVTVLLGFFINRVFRLRPRLFYSVGHSSNLIVDQPLLDGDGKQISPTQIVRTASITVGNGGLQAAKALEVTFNWKPVVINVWPPRLFEEATGALARYSIKMESLAPNEQFTIEIMSINSELPNLTVVRSEDCVGKMISMAPQRVWPTWYLRIVGALLICGLVTSVYLAVIGLQAIASS